MSLSKNNRAVVGFVALAALLITGVYFIFLRADRDRAEVGGDSLPETVEAEEASQPAAAPEVKPVAPDPLPLTVLEDAPFAREFGAAGTSPARELELVQLAFADYLSFVKERYRRPFGYHEELVALLVGGNPLRVAPVPPGHERIDAKGRLTDHWGTPLDIHPLSSTAIEIRSAGPDRKMQTADDLHNVRPSGQDILDRMRPLVESSEGRQETGAREGLE